MALKHQLMLDIPDSSNPRVFRVLDSSIYGTGLPTDCATIQVIPPGFSDAAKLDVEPGFNLVMNACSINMQTADCGEVSRVIPDGIYIVRYSVSPNDKVFVEYNHLRATNLLGEYYEKLAKLEISGSDPCATILSEVHELRLIESMIKAAKANVEVAHFADKGMALFNNAKKRLGRIGSC